MIKEYISYKIYQAQIVQKMIFKMIINGNNQMQVLTLTKSKGLLSVGLLHDTGSTENILII